MYYTKSSQGKYNQISDEEILCAAENIQRSWITKRGQPIDSVESAEKLVRSMFRHPDREQFVLIVLDTKKQFLEAVVVTTGTINSARVHIRELVKLMLKHEGAVAIIAHNHPTGSHYPSSNDLEITQNIQKAFKFMDMELLDHLIVGESIFSFKNEKYL